MQAEVVVDGSWSVLRSDLTKVPRGADVRDLIPAITSARTARLKEGRWTLILFSSEYGWLRLVIDRKAADNTRTLFFSSVDPDVLGDYRVQEAEQYSNSIAVQQTIATYAWPRLGPAMGAGIITRRPSVAEIKAGEIEEDLAHELKASIWEGHNRAVLYRFMLQRGLNNEWVRFQRTKWNLRSDDRRQDYAIVQSHFPELDSYYPAEPLRPIEIIMHAVQALYDSFSKYPGYLKNAPPRTTRVDTAKLRDHLVATNPLNLEGEALTTWIDSKVEAALAATTTVGEFEPPTAQRGGKTKPEHSAGLVETSPVSEDYAAFLATLFSHVRADIATFWLLAQEESYSTPALLQVLTGVERGDKDFDKLKKYVERNFDAIRDRVRVRGGSDVRLQDMHEEAYGVAVSGPGPEAKKPTSTKRVSAAPTVPQNEPPMYDVDNAPALRPLGPLWGRTVEDYYSQFTGSPATKPLEGIAGK